ncbi:K(+)-transporting ATPase subunit F [Acidithrix ferrooxidans]
MSVNLVLLVGSIAIFGYLCYALWRPERF